jgi:glutathione S-transferase
MMQLIIANKNYSSWSMRSWVLLKAFDIPFEEKLLCYPTEQKDGLFEQDTPTGKVPVLIDNEFLIWDTLAIAEYLAEKYPEKNLWPVDLKQRTRARCIAAEMHSGFLNLREHCGMNIRAQFQKVGAQLWEEHLKLQHDIARIEKIWSDRPSVDGFLCGNFSIADAFYAPVVTRILTYGLPVSENTQRYMQSMLLHPAVKAWIDEALTEINKVEYYEIYQEI